MANLEHLAFAREDSGTWNSWRQRNPEINPDLSRAELSRARLAEADLHGVDLSSADLREAELGRANLVQANLKEANLSGADLSGSDLTRCDLSGAKLRWADFSCTILSDANLSGANLSGSNLAGADLSGADLAWANLTEAKLGGCNLTRVDFRWADLRLADLTEAKLGWTIFVSNDLSSTKGLDTVGHAGPSGVGIDTAYASMGDIPDIFLRGAGVPDSFITYVGSLVGKPIEFYSCFISYATKDQPFADRLYADLQAKGVRCWFAPHDMAGGRKVHEQIDEAIRLYDRLLLILSPASMVSEWVNTEIAKARKREIKEKTRVLFPVSLVDYEMLRDWELFDGDTGKDTAREIREYFIPDFSLWMDHESYQEAFHRLLRDLKAPAPQKSLPAVNA